MATVNLPDLKSKISVEDQATPVLKNVQKATKETNDTFKIFTPTMAAVAVGAGALAAAIQKSVEAYAESELAVKKLNDALSVAGLKNQDYSKHLQSVAADLQKTTRFSDEQVMSVQQLLVTYGVYGKTLDKATKSILDLAETTDRDAFSAAQALAKAVEGNTDGLRRYGVMIDDSVPKSQKFAAALQQIQDRMGGRAAGAADTLTGSFTIVKNAMSELLEKTGEFITKSTGLVRILKDLGVFMNQLRIDFGGGTEKENIINKIKQLSEMQMKEGDTPLGRAYQARLDEEYAKLDAINKKEQDATAEAQKQYELQQKNLELAEKRKKAAEDYKKLVEGINKIQDQQNANSDSGRLLDQRLEVERAIKSGNLEVMQKESTLLATRLQAISDEELNANREFGNHMIRKDLNLEDMEKLAKELDNISKRRELTQKEKENIDLAMKALREQKLTAGIGAVSSFVSGNASGAASGVASMLGATGPQGAAIGLLVELVANSKEIPEKIGAMLKGLATGLVEGIPALLDYLSGPFISDLITKFIPALVKGITQFFPLMIAAIIKGIGEILKNLPNLLVGLVKGVASGVWDGIKGIGSAIGSIFGFGGDDRTTQEKLRDTIKELSTTIKQLNNTLSSQYRDVLRSVASPASQLAMAKTDFSNLAQRRDNLIGQIIKAGESGDTKKAAELMQKLADTQGEMISKAQDYYNLELDRIQSIYDKKKEVYDKEREQLKQRLDDLKNLRDNAISSIQSAREAIISGTLNPNQNVDRLRAAFQNAGSPEAKSAAAQALAGGLQSQFQNAQSLAASGAITGEEFAKIQEDILSQLDSTQTEVQTQFGQLIDTQREQIRALDRGFKQVTDAYKKEMADLRAVLLTVAKQLSKLPDLAGGSGSVKDPSLTFKKSLKENRNNIKGSL